MQSKFGGLLRFFAGVLAPALLGWAVCVGYGWLFDRWGPGHGQFAELARASAYPNLILVPMTMGIMAAYFWRSLQLPVLMYLLGALMITVISLGGADEVMKEGAVCLLIVSPLLLVAVFAGTAVGRALFQRRDKLQVTVIPLLVILTFLEGASHTGRRVVVTDGMVINAPAAEVWKHVVAFPRIAAEPDYWLNKRWPAECGGNYVRGRVRRCKTCLYFQQRPGVQRSRL